MSIMPRRLRPGGQVTIHIGLVNRSHQPICPYLRVTIFDPTGRSTRLVHEHVLVFPNYDESDTLLERRRRMDSSYHIYSVPEGAPLGRYRVKVENFLDGRLRYSADVERDFFFVEDLQVGRARAKGDGYVVAISNRSPEPVPVQFYSSGADEIEFDAQKADVPPNKTTEFALEVPLVFLRYAGVETVPITIDDSPLCLRNQRFFWREEDEETIFVLDPRAERKRNFFLTGRAREAWLASTGVVQRDSVRTTSNADLYSTLISKELILELKL